MRVLLSGLFIFFAFFQAVGQENNLLFEKLTHEFGEIKEEQGSAFYEFSFKNVSDKPVKISNVRASCGCTTPDWTKNEIAPGEEGFIQAKYSTINRPGRFRKSLTVTTNDKETTKLYITGNVIPKPKSIEEQLPSSNGNLRTKYRSFNMGRVLTKEEPTVKTFRLYNAGNEPLIITNIQHPAHVKIELPDTLNANQEDQIKVIYDARKKGDLGFFSDNITFVTNEPVDSVKSFSLFANIEEYFPPMSKEEFEETARLSFGEQIYDFDRVTEGDVVEHTYTLKNQGHSVLSIRKIEPNCSCVKTSISSKEILPGESAELKAKFYTEGRKGTQQKAITVYSNDPSSPVQRLSIKGYIKSND